jgi:heat shock protein HslJ
MKTASLLFSLPVLLFFACQSQKEQSGELTNAAWQLEAFYDAGGARTPAQTGTVVSLQFDAETGRITGNTGCNTYGGSFEISGERLPIGEMFMTKRACLEPSFNEQEKRFTEALQAAEKFKIEGDKLTIFTKTGEQLLFQRVSEMTTSGDTTDAPGTAAEPVTVEALLTDAQGQLPAWFSFYEKHFPDLSAEGFEATVTSKPDSLLVMPVYDVKAFEPWLKPSPGGNRLLDLYSYERVVKTDKAGKVQDIVAGGPDWEVAVLDTATGKRTRLLFCGTPCAFEDGFWRGENEVVVVGYFQETGRTYHPSLWWIDVRTGEVRQFVFKNGKENFGGESYLKDVVFGQ